MRFKLFFILIFIYIGLLCVPAATAFAASGEYFNGASIVTNITCFNVVADSSFVLKYDKINLRENTEWLTAEWLDINGLGSNQVVISAKCVDSFNKAFPITVEYSYGSTTKSVSDRYSFYANSTNLGTHKFVVKCTINSKIILKTLLVNVVRTVQGTSDIRYRTSGIIPKNIRLISNPNKYILTFNSPPVIEVENLNLTKHGQDVLNQIIPLEFRKGEECVLNGYGVITVYNIHTNKTLGVYRLDTRYDDLLSDFNWSSGAQKDFLSRRNFNVPYRNKISTKYSIEYIDSDSGQRISDLIKGTIDYYAYEVECFGIDIEPADKNGYRIIKGIPYIFIADTLGIDGNTTLSRNSFVYLTLSSAGSYDASYDNKIGTNRNLEIVYYFEKIAPTLPPSTPRPSSPTPTAATSPTPTPTPSKGTIVICCLSKNTLQVISTRTINNIQPDVLNRYEPPEVAGYVHHPDDVDFVDASVRSLGTTYILFYYAKLGSVIIEHRDAQTHALLVSSELTDIVLLEDMDMGFGCLRPGEIPGYVHESEYLKTVSPYIYATLTEANPNITVVFNYVAAKCTIKYMVLDGTTEITVKVKQLSLPSTLSILGRINLDGTETSSGAFRYIGNDYSPGSTDNALYLTEADSNQTITLKFSREIVLNSLTITGAYTHWKNDPDRFMCFEKIKIVCNADYAEKMVVRFSPELEAMVYTSPSGIKYYYADFFNKYITFPGDSTVDFVASKAQWSYSLPLANETISWANRVNKPPYYVDITLEKGNYRQTFRRTIDITGKVTDIIYPQ